MQTKALPGFREFYPADLALRTHIFRTWRTVATRYGFEEYAGPLLEPLWLYTKKSGDEIVGQLYNFTDKGGRDIALRPEMTPTLARMAAAKAAALRQPIRWFSTPQVFRCERQQRGRLREHFQLNVDIIGEADVTADSELLSVAIEVMRGCGLSAHDVRARASDRRLLHAILGALGVADERHAAVLGVVDKVHRQPADVSREKLTAAGMPSAALDDFMSLMKEATLDELDRRFGESTAVKASIDEFRRYFACLEGLGVLEWVTIDL